MNIDKFNEVNWAEPIEGLGGNQNPNQKVMLRWDSNWADEMDVAGFVIVNKIDSDSWQNHIESVKGRFDICIGTNEEIDYRNGKELLSEVHAIEISDVEYQTFIRTIGHPRRLWYERVTGIGYGLTNFFQRFEAREGRRGR